MGSFGGVINTLFDVDGPKETDSDASLRSRSIALPFKYECNVAICTVSVPLSTLKYWGNTIVVFKYSAYHKAGYTSTRV